MYESEAYFVDSRMCYDTFTCWLPLMPGDLDLAKTVLEEFLAPNLTSNNYAFAAQE